MHSKKEHWEFIHIAIPCLPTTTKPAKLRLTATKNYKGDIMRQAKYMYHVVHLTFPNMVCFLLSSSALPRVKKNWLPLSLEPPLAMATRPRRVNLRRWWNSSLVIKHRLKNTHTRTEEAQHTVTHMHKQIKWKKSYVNAV